MPMSDDVLAGVRNSTDAELVRLAGTEDLAAVVEANIRLKNSNERLERHSTILIRLTRWLIGLTIALIVVTLPLVIHDLLSKWW